MPVYTYIAKNLKGEVITDTYETANRESLEFMLREKGYFITAVEEKGKTFTFANVLGGIDKKDLALFCRQFSVIINSGITILEAISILCDQAEKKKMSDVLEDIKEELQKGKVLSDSLSMHPDVFPEFLVNMVQVGESSGTLDIIMNRLADYYEKENRMRRKIRTAMTYPTILGILTVCIVLILMWKILPMFSGILTSMGGELPGITKFMLGMSNFVVKYILIILLIIATLVALLSYYFKSEAGRFWFDGLKITLPLVRRTNIKIITSKFARSMGILLRSGIPIIDAIDLMSDLIGNRVVEKKFKSFKDEVREGRGISAPIEKIGIFPPLLIHMIKVGENTGELDEMLTRTAGFFDEEVEESIDKLTSMIEPAMLIILAAVVGTIIASVMFPMLSIMSSVH